MKINFSRADNKFNFSEAALANVEHFDRGNTISQSAKDAAWKELEADMEDLQLKYNKSLDEARAYVFKKRPRCAHLMLLTPVRDESGADVELGA
jgi:hypothetical protein